MNIIDRLISVAKSQDQSLGPALPHSYRKNGCYPLIQSAVLIPCFQVAGSETFELLLTVRQQTLSSHAGQVCFPGGRFDEQMDKNFSDTALRECFEETRIPKKNIRLLGTFGYLDTITGYRIYPYMSLIQNMSPTDLIMNQAEISDYFFVKMKHVLDLSTYSQTTREFNNQTFSSYWFNYSGYKVWGATARILYLLAKSIAEA